VDIMNTPGRIGTGLAALAATLALLAVQPVLAASKHPIGEHHGSTHATQTYSGSHASHAATKHQPTSHVAGGKHGGSKAATGVKRDEHGKIARSGKAKDDFKKSHPCPSTGKSSGACPGYVIDHVTPLKRGGADSPSNMQWQTTAAAKSKDKTE
jgi:hypothetical protein